MIRLRQTKGADNGRELEFVLARVRIGRLPDSEVSFDPEEDLDASGRHAEIRRERGGYWIVDTESRNGTWLNGERVKRAKLRAGDELEFGRGGPRLLVTELKERSMAARASTEPFYSAPPPAEEEDPFSVPVTVTTKLEHITAGLAPGPVATSGFNYAAPSVGDTFNGPEADTLPPPPANPAGVVPGSLVGARRRKSWPWLAGAGAVLALGVAAVLFVPRGPESSDVVVRPVEVTGLGAERLRPAVRRVVGEDGEGVRTTLCMAFSVMDRLYATTASCVERVRQGQSRGLRHVVQDEGSEVAEVERMWRHPDYDPKVQSPNVGLLEVAVANDAPVHLASPTRIGELRPGQAVSLFDGLEPSVSTTISSIESLQVDPSGGAARLSHGAVASDGSPIVAEDGVVLGIHVAAHGAVEAYGVRADRIDGLVRGLQLTARQEGSAALR